MIDKKVLENMGNAKYLVVEYSDGRLCEKIEWAIPVYCDRPLDPIKEAILNSDIFDDVYKVKRIAENIVGDRKKKGFLDIGGNIGKFAVIFSLGGWETATIEAADENVKALKITELLNDFQYKINNKIVYDESGKLNFYANGPYGMVSKGNAIHEAVFKDIKPVEIDSICLDDIENTCVPDQISFIKMDIEGSEVAAVRGGKEFLKKHEYPVIFCESNKWTLYTQGETSLSLINELKALGYSAYYVTKDDKLRLLGDEIQVTCNIDLLFVHGWCSIPDSLLDSDVVERDYNHGFYQQLCLDNKLEVVGTIYSLKDYPDIKELPLVKEKLESIKKTEKDNPIFKLALETV